MNQIGVDRELLKAVAPEQPMQQDEQGGCVWCGEDSCGSSSFKDYDRHEADCPWGLVRKIICESAESVVDADGMVPPLEFRDYIRSRGYGVEEELLANDRTCAVYTYNVRAPKKRTRIDSYSVPVDGIWDDVKRPLGVAKQWCDEQDVKWASSIGSGS
jgi:hypothetical protein